MLRISVFPFFFRWCASWIILIWTADPSAAAEWTLPTPPSPPPGIERNLIPYPRSVTWETGALRFDRWQGDLGALRPEWRAGLAEEIRGIGQEAGLRNEGVACTIRMVMRPPADAPLAREAYALRITPEAVSLSASDPGGFFNGLQTLRQLTARETDGRWKLPCCQIDDEPAFQIRGVMLDVGRNYVEPALIRDIVHRLSRYKINTLQLHLTDDPAWRFETKRFPRLTSAGSMWPTRQPGKSYDQATLRALVADCAAHHVRVIPEIDMPGHSAAFERAMGFGMQSREGLETVKQTLQEAAGVFPDPLFHIGSDEARSTMQDFVPQMLAHVRGLKRDPIVWFPGQPVDENAVLMCWGENEAGHSIAPAKKQRYIDANGFYVDWMDSQSGVLQTFFQQPCEVPIGNDQALGTMMTVWTDGALSSGHRILEQYPFYPVALTFAERSWRGAREKRRDCMAAFPAKGTPEWRAMDEFEQRLVWHRDHAFKDQPFAYVRQSEMKWWLIGPFDHHGQNDRSFEPETLLRETYAVDGHAIQWQPAPAYGGAVWLRHLYAMFNSSRGGFRLDHWPTVMSPRLGKGDGTCYALCFVDSPVDQEVGFMFGLNGMWGHSGGYRSGRAPEPGSWDFGGGAVWVNGTPVPAPQWKFPSLPWTGWGRGRIEIPLTEEGYFFRPPVNIQLRRGINRILVRSVAGPWHGDPGDRKWFFCAMPVRWDGTHFSEVANLHYPDIRPGVDAK